MNGDMRGSARAQDRDVEAVVRSAKRFWFQARVPWPQRDRMTEKLRRQLHVAVEQGSEIDGVVGDDPVRYAAAWRRAIDHYRWGDVAITTVMGALLLAGTLAFLGPMTETGRLGLTQFGLVLVALSAVGALIHGVVVNVRDRLSRSAVLLIAIASGVLAVGVASAVGGDMMSTNIVLPLPAGFAAAMAACALTGQALRWKIRRDDIQRRVAAMS